MMDRTTNFHNKPVVSIRADAAFNLQVTNTGTDVEGEAHALMTVAQYVRQRLSELCLLIAEPKSKERSDPMLSVERGR
jgi:hypothetical protein